MSTPVAKEKTVMVTLGGRDIEMREPTDGALVVLSRAFLGMPKIQNVGEITQQMQDKLVRNLGLIGRIVEEMIVQDDDKNWLDEAMISGDVSAEDVMGSIKVAGEKFNGQAPAKKAAPPVRRARGR